MARWRRLIGTTRWCSAAARPAARDDEVLTRRSSGCASWSSAGDPAGREGRRRGARASARGFFHPVGTCAIGSVLDERCRVLGFENLYVVDAAAIPEIQSANTKLTTVALAERASNWL
ncbi:MAG: GMC family oxidoreductase [Gaiellaceae bacterium]